MMRKKSLSPGQAFHAMFIFLSEYHFRTGGTSDLGSLLSDIQLNRTDGLPTDPAAWDDWLAAIEQALTKRGELASQALTSQKERR